MRLVSVLSLFVLVLTACGGIDDEAAESAATSETDDTMVVVDEETTTTSAATPATDDDAASPDTAPDALALREDDAGADEAPGTTAAAADDVLPPVDELDAALAGFGECLNDNGADVAPFTLQDMITRAAGMPLVETRVEMFGFFLDQDPTDQAFAGAVEVCNPLIDEIPGLAAFIPAG